MGITHNPKKLLNDSIISEIGAAVATLHAGEVTIKVCHKKLRQIEVIERKRFDDVWALESGGGI